MQRGDAPDAEFVGGKLDRITHQIETASRIVDDLRNFVRGSDTRSTAPFDPTEAINSAVRLTEYGARQAGIGLSLELAGASSQRGRQCRPTRAGVDKPDQQCA